MLIPLERFHAAARRLAIRYLQNKPEIVAAKLNVFEFDAVLRRAAIPRAWVKLSLRLIARGHIIIDENTREIIRKL